MFAQAVQATTFLAAIGSGLMAGLFFAYSNSAAPALMRLPPEQGAAAMNHVNAVILNPLFLGVFMGTAVLSLMLAGAVLFGVTARSGWVLVAAALYLIGNIGVTAAVHVPMNEALSAATPDNLAALWTASIDKWLWWNHVRTIACTGALAAFIAALLANATA